MSKTTAFTTLLAKRERLTAEIKQLDQAIKIAQEKEALKKQKTIIDALAAKGLLDRPIDELLAALEAANQTAPAPAQPARISDELAADL